MKYTTQRHFLPVLAIALFAAVSACTLSTPQAEPSPLALPTLLPTRADLPPPASATSASAAAEAPDSGWQAAGEGVELRRIRLPAAPGTFAINITAIRLDPAYIRFSVGYAPGQPPTMEEWLQQRAPLALINGGFFSEAFESTALVISAGVASGESYVGRGGMFAVDSAGNVSLRSLADQPYAPGEQLAEALQGWPMLIKPGGALAYTGEDPDVARRSVVAIDTSGRVLLLACPTSGFTLRDLAAWLATSDMQIDAALNLDGGSSTGLYLADAVRIDPFVRLPLVMLATRR